MFEKGELVRLIGETEEYTDDFSNTWHDCMRRHIGEVGEVVLDTGKNGVKINFDHPEEFTGGYFYPHSELRRVGQGRWSILNREQ